MTMFLNARTAPRTSVQGEAFAVIARIVADAIAWPGRVMAARRLMSAMAGMSAHDLADIGLSQQDIADAAALPLAAEPGAFLAQRVDGRRRSR